MNNRIWELATQATRELVGMSPHRERWKEKFAKLIILECVTVLEKYSKANMESDSWAEMISMMQKDLLSISE